MKKQREKYDTTAIQWKHSRSLIILKRRDIVTASFSYFHIIMLSSGLFRASTHIYTQYTIHSHTHKNSHNTCPLQYTMCMCVCGMVYIEPVSLSLLLQHSPYGQFHRLEHYFCFTYYYFLMKIYDFLQLSF